MRGAIADRDRVRGVRRLLHRDRETGDPPTLIDHPRRWLALDVDNLARPPELAAVDLAGCAGVAIAALPEAFHGVHAVVQATAGHGLKPGLRLRLWFWLSRRTTGLELKYWLRAAPVDRTVFGPAQLIYTAAPVFARGAHDPLGDRILLLSRVRDVAIVPAPSALVPSRPRPAAAAGGSDAQVLQRLARRVIHAPHGQRNSVLFWAACRVGEQISSGVVEEGSGVAVLTGAALRAGLPESEAQQTIASGVRTGLR